MKKKKNQIGFELHEGEILQNVLFTVTYPFKIVWTGANGGEEGGE